jgi:DNA-binding transcriptional LysR family regulator
MSDQQFRYFLVCAIEKSITKASERIGISQSALSQQISSLEKSVGLKLFERRGRGIQLTEAGNRLFSELHPLFNAIDTTVKEIQLQEGVHQGTIAIAGVHSILPYLLPKLISDYSNSFANVGFKLYTRSSQDVIQLALNRTVDIGLVYQNQVFPPELEVEHLYDEELVAVTAAESQFASELLKTRTLPKGAPVILFSPGYSLRMAVDQAFRNEKLNVTTEVETSDMLLSLVENGAGISFMPSYMVENNPNLVHTCLKGMKITLGMVMINRYKKNIQPISSMFIKRMKEFCENR